MPGIDDRGDGRAGEPTLNGDLRRRSDGAPGRHVTLAPDGCTLGEVPGRHGPIAVRDVFVRSSDDQQLRVSAVVDNGGHAPVAVDVIVQSGHLAAREAIRLDPACSRRIDVSLGCTRAPHWTPEYPSLHQLVVDAWVGASLSDRWRTRFGLRMIRIAGGQLLVDGVPYLLRGADVHADEPGIRTVQPEHQRIRTEVQGAKALGLNTLRIHRPFDPAYLDVCDELGMFVVPDLGESRRCTDTGPREAVLATGWQTDAVEQVRRDRNHPSILLWCVGNGPGAASRSVVDALRAADPTRPYVEDGAWLTGSPPGRRAPWAAVDDRSEEKPRRPVSTRARHRESVASSPADLAATPWPATEAEFLRGAERSRNVAERVRIERLRQRDDTGGSWLPRLVEKPGELNGPLDPQRRPKPAALVELGRANQTVLPMLTLASFVFRAGRRQVARLSISNDGPVLRDAVLRVRLGAWTARRDLGVLRGGAQIVGDLGIQPPRTPGGHELVLRLSSRLGPSGENRYPVHVVVPRPAGHAVWLVRTTGIAGALARIGATICGGSARRDYHLAEWSPSKGPVLVAEEALDAATGAVLQTVLAAGGTAVVLAQNPEAAPHYPLPVVLTPTGACREQLVRFTTDHNTLPSLPRRRVLTVEDDTMTPTAVFTRLGSGPWASATVVGAWSSAPGLVRGTVVGVHPVGAGRLIVCQLRLLDGEVAALCLLSELVRWAAAPGEAMARERVTLTDGRGMIFFSFGRPMDRE